MMIGKVVGAIAGAEAARHTKKIGGVGGAVLGAVAVPVIARMRWPTLLVLGAGGYLFNRMAKKGRPGPEHSAAQIG